MFLKTLFTTTLLLILTVNSIKAQAQIVDHNFNIWSTNINEYILNDHWYLSSEVHIRRTNGFHSWQQFLFRPAVNYKLNENIHFTAGYTYILSYPYGEQPLATTTPENNIWEQIILNHGIGIVNFSHRYRLEHRFIGDPVLNNKGSYDIQGTSYAQRFRYRLTGTFPIIKDGKWFGAFFDEAWIILADNFMPLSFNQNWLYAGLGYRFSDRGNIQLGYMNQLIRKGDGVHYESNPTIQFTVVYKFEKLR